MVLNLVLNLILMHPLAHVGLALATALAAWFNVTMLAVILHRRGTFTMDDRLRRRAPRILLASLAMAAVLLGAEHLLRPLATGTLATLGVVAALVALGLGVFLVAAHLLGAAHFAEVKTMLRRRR